METITSRQNPLMTHIRKLAGSAAYRRQTGQCLCDSPKLLRGAAGGSFSCYDMAAAIMPAFVLSATAIVCNVTAAILGAVHGEDLTIALWSVGQMLLNMYLTLFVLGAITTVTEWRRIHTKAVKKVLYAFTFPLFMFTYIPISFAALFSKGEWKPIEHRVSAASLRGRGREELLPF